jgi:hypothetical protein
MLLVSRILIPLMGDTLRWWRLAFRSTRSIKAENLFLRRQLALYVERGVKPRRIDPVTRISLTFLSRFFNWREALVVVRPQTMIRWHRAGWKLFWRMKSRPGRPPIPQQLQALIRRMANENPSIATTRIHIRAIAAENRTPSEPSRSLADCITNISSHLPVRNSIFVDHRRSLLQ